jgi:outer membrane protein TolC
MIMASGASMAQVRFDGLDQCLEYAREHNVTVQTEKINQQISNEQVKAARGVLFPQVKAVASLDNNLSLPVQLVPAAFLGGNEGEYAEVQFGTQYNASYGVEAGLSLINVSNWKNIRAAVLGSEASRFQALDREQTISEQVITAYYNTLLSREAVDLNSALASANDSLMRIATARLEQGAIEPLDHNRIKAIYLESVYQLRESQGLFNTNKNALRALLGVPENDSLLLTERVADKLISASSAARLAVHGDQAPRYQMLSYRLLQAREEMKRQRSEVYPDLSLFARYSRQAFRNEFDFFSSGQSWYDIAVVGVKAEWNLFTGLSRQASIRQASLQADVAQREMVNYTLQTEKELAELETNHKVAAYGASRYGEHYQLSRDNYTIAGIKYSQGVYTLDQFITIYQEMVRSQNLYLSSLARYFIYDSIIKTKNEYQVK